MESQKFEERRTVPRFPLYITAICLVTGTTADIPGHTKDISTNGLGIVCEKEFTPGDKVDVCLKMIDNNETIHVVGRVIWSNGNIYGKFRSGIKLEKDKLNAIQLVLRTIKALREY